MKRRFYYGPRYKRDQTEPHLWFAWYPVMLSGDGCMIFVWLEYLMRNQAPSGAGYKWVYMPRGESSFMEPMQG